MLFPERVFWDVSETGPSVGLAFGNSCTKGNSSGISDLPSSPSVAKIDLRRFPQPSCDIRGAY